MNQAPQGQTNAGILRSAQNDNSKIGGRQAVVCTSDEVDRPTVIGFFAPKILIPGWLLEKLTAAELEQVVLHETGHLGRADDWMNLLQKIALVVFPLNPVLTWVERRLCLERELAVDESVLRACAGKAGAAKAYAACLATLAEYRLERRAIVPRLALVLGALGRESNPSQQAGWGPRSELGRRVGRILRRGESMKPLHGRLVLGGAMLGLLGAAVGLERCPPVVGFEKQGTGIREQGTANGAAGGYRYQAVVLQALGSGSVQGGRTRLNVPGGAVRVSASIANENKILPQQVNRIHEVLTMSRKAEDVRDSRARGPAGAVRMVQTSAAVPAALRARMGGAMVVSDVQPSRAAAGEMQWVVVTSWQRPDGSRVVLTSVQTSRVMEPEAGDATDAADAIRSGGESPANGESPSNQVYPYAAVPVRGGWLIIQM
jgi:hypothetical protein